MKSLITLSAAALLAGVSIASAQMSQPSSAPSAGAKQATGTGQFCITTSASNSSLNCKFASMAACEKEAKAQNLQCSANPNKSTTGSKM